MVLYRVESYLRRDATSRCFHGHTYVWEETVHFDGIRIRVFRGAEAWSFAKIDKDQAMTYRRRDVAGRRECRI
jgi:hypothetical protein